MAFRLNIPNNLNLELGVVNTFKSRWHLLSNSLQVAFETFITCRQNFSIRATNLQLDGANYEKQVQGIFSEFEKHFTDFTSNEPVASYLCCPFVDCIASKVASIFHLDTCAVENEVLTLQSDIEVKSRETSDSKGDFWHLLLEQKYPHLKTCD